MKKGRSSKSSKASSKAAPKKMMKRPSKTKATEQQAPVGPPAAPMQQPPQTPVGTPPPGANGPLMKKGGMIKKKAQAGTTLGKTLPVPGPMKSGGKMKKAKTGTSLGMKSLKAGYDKNSGVTRADFVSIGKGTAKSGKTIKKAFLGSMLGGAASNLIGGIVGGKEKSSSGNSNLSKIAMRNTADAMSRPMGGAAKSGKSMKKCKYGCK